MPTLRPASDFLNAARAILAEQREALRAAGIPGELMLEGGSSVAGAVTRGDVDLHLRVAPDDFESAVSALAQRLRVVHPEIWSPTLATFEVPEHHGPDRPTGIAVTPIGSEHDLRFTRTWQLLRADPALVAEYNAVKAPPTIDGGPADPLDASYEDRKSAFFDRVVALWPDHPAGGRAVADPCGCAAADPGED